MWSFSRPSSDNASHNMANVRPPIEHSDSARITLRKFSGYPAEDPARFLSDFQAYCTICRINDTDGRKVAAFQLHLQGPANTWFNCLEDDDKADWDNLAAAFEINYCAENNTQILLVETEKFTNLTLLPHQQIEDYYSQILEKGKKLSKSDQEQLLKFIQGLPAQLAFFVRAGNPSDIHTAMTSAKMGEAYGYRASPLPDSSNLTVGTVSAAHSTSDNQRINSLEKSVQTLCSKLDSILVKNDCSSETSVRERKRSCFTCKGQGHIKRACNWKQTLSADPTALCTLCSQYGHAANDCKHQGNFRSPRERGGVPLGGQQ